MATPSIPQPLDALCQNNLLGKGWMFSKQAPPGLSVVKVGPEKHCHHACRAARDFHRPVDKLGRQFIGRISYDRIAAGQRCRQEIIAGFVDVRPDNLSVEQFKHSEHFPAATGRLPNEGRLAEPFSQKCGRHPLGRLVQIPLFALVSAVSLAHAHSFRSCWATWAHFNS
jgi:hypothetical protein